MLPIGYSIPAVASGMTTYVSLVPNLTLTHTSHQVIYSRINDLSLPLRLELDSQPRGRGRLKTLVAIS